MAIVSNIKFGAQLPQQAAAPSTTPRVPAEFWMNIGYRTQVLNEETGEMVEKFVSLKQGVPLDTMARNDVSKGSKAYLQPATAQNELLDDVLEACKSLEPGEDRYITELEIQLHRVRGPAEVIAPSENPFRRKMSFA